MVYNNSDHTTALSSMFWDKVTKIGGVCMVAQNIAEPLPKGVSVGNQCIDDDLYLTNHLMYTMCALYTNECAHCIHSLQWCKSIWNIHIIDDCRGVMWWWHKGIYTSLWKPYRIYIHANLQLSCRDTSFEFYRITIRKPKVGAFVKTNQIPMWKIIAPFLPTFQTNV